MAFCFTEEDFRRYVKKEEHGGRHIWDDLQEQLGELFGVPFSSVPYIARGDRLQRMWFAPKGGPRSIWSNQAQFFLGRNITEKQLTFGLEIERSPQADITALKLAPDLDALRLIAQLHNNRSLADQVDEFARKPSWAAGVEQWGKRENRWLVCTSSSEILNKVESFPPEQGWGVIVQRSLSAEEAIAAGEGIVDQVMDAYKALRPIWEAVIPEADREFLRTGASPKPAEPTAPPSPATQDTPGDPLAKLARPLSAQGLHFTPWQIATFYTALQTKGFVILSGISGTGKTKLAQHFAEMLPQPLDIALLGVADGIKDEQAYGNMRPFAYWWSYPIRNDVELALTLPFRLYTYYHGQITHVHTVTDYRTLAGDQGLESPWPDITLPDERNMTGPADRPGWKFKTWCKVSQLTRLDRPIELSSVRALFGYKNDPSALRNALVPIEDPQMEPNYLFVSVRPDWRDSKSLLGYYNPLTQIYEPTDFLRFLQRAERNYRSPQPVAWFVILDEMNLAHVEYYFADLLSVLESGRDEAGWTKEPLRLSYPAEAQGDLPPRELKLPPNLYIVGTVNVDETTQAFSPKVLDRAFTLELTEADFSDYPPVLGADQAGLTEGERQAILEDFSQKGAFARIDKDVIARYVAEHPEVRARLQALNGLLRPHDLHFGYRVFDEIVSFLAAAEGNELYADLGGAEAAFDAAVLMKVLPKFHGSRGKLEAALKEVLAWCINPDQPAVESVEQTIQDNERAGNDVMAEKLLALNYTYRQAANRTVRMLRALYETGFAAFA